MFQIQNLTKDKINLLDKLNNSKIIEPTITHFLKYEKDETILTYKIWQNWQKNYFDYHTGKDGYRGLCEIFPLENLSSEICQLIYDCIITLDKLKIKKFIDDLFDKLKSFDNIKIEYDFQKINLINIPNEILLLKFLRELLCN